MKKIVSMFAAALILTSAMTVTVFAHGHGRGNSEGWQTGYTPCTEEGCEITHTHQHGKNWYCQKTELNGSYEICTAADCTAIGLHEHNGVYYQCQNYEIKEDVGRGCHHRHH